MTAQSRERIRCHKCRTVMRPVPADHAARWYAMLSPFLRLVPPHGCYTPVRGLRNIGKHEAWPLHFWRGPGTFPLVAEWTARDDPGERLTFEQFLRVYGLELVHAPA